MAYCSTGITEVQRFHNPEEGRSIWNQNFKNLDCAIGSIISSGNTGSTIVASGDDNIEVSLSGMSVPPIYGVSLNDNISVDSISANTYYVGDVPLSATTSGLTYTNTTPTTATVGGIDAGSTFSGANMSEMWDMLLYPYQAPKFNAFAINGQSTTLEVGDSVPAGSTLFTWSTTNSSNVASNSITIQDITNVLILGSGLADDGSESLSLPANVTKTSATSNQWRITASDTEAGGLLRNFNVNWRWRVNYGTDPSTTLTAAGVTGLTNSSLSSGFAGTRSFGAGDYKYFAYPAVMGTATTFKDSSTNLDVAMEALYTVSITNAFSVSTTYNVHRSTNVLGSTIDIIIS
jgi:hypothetical protein